MVIESSVEIPKPIKRTIGTPKNYGVPENTSKNAVPVAGPYLVPLGLRVVYGGAENGVFAVRPQLRTMESVSVPSL